MDFPLSSYKIASVPSTTSFTLNDNNEIQLHMVGNGSSNDTFKTTWDSNSTKCFIYCWWVSISRSINEIDDVIDEQHYH